MPKNGYGFLTAFRQNFFMILVSAVAATASHVAREWNGHRSRPAHTHVKRRASQQADFRSSERAPHTQAQFKASAPHPRAITMQDLTTPEHEIEARNSRHTKLKPATPHDEIEARNSQHTKLKSTTPENEIEVRNSQHTKLKPTTPDNEIEARNSQHTKLKPAAPDNEIEIQTPNTRNSSL